MKSRLFNLQLIDQLTTPFPIKVVVPVKRKMVD